MNGAQIRRSATPNTILSYLNTPSDPYAADAKDAGGLDWYVEGPGRRVGYDNLTAIDWIYEYSKERTRLRQLTANSPGLVGQLRIAVDKSQIWWILIATGLSVGGIAAGIDVVSDWLGDLKTGYCSNVQDGGKFYLNKAFCCWETSTYAECADWRSWSQAMGLGSGNGGSYIVSYILYVGYSVSTFYHHLPNPPRANVTSVRSSSPSPPPSSAPTSRHSHANQASPKSRPCSAASSSVTSLAHGLSSSNRSVSASQLPRVSGSGKKGRSST